MFASAEPNARRMLAHGFRNAVAARDPARHQRRLGRRPRRRLLGGARPRARPDRPGAQLRLALLRGRHGRERQPVRAIRPRSDDQDLDICEDLYAEVTATSAPYWAYDHEQPVVPGEDCAVNPDAASRPATRSPGSPSTRGGIVPAAYRGALFFGDRLRNCIWAMLPGPDGVPDRGQVVPFAQQAGSRSTIEIAPGGDMLYVDRRRTRSSGCVPGGTANQPPTAVAQADATTGNAPLTVNFDGSASSDPDPGGRRARLRVGPRRGRRAGRLDRRGPDVHLHGARHVHGHAARDRHVRRHRHRHPRRSPRPGRPPIDSPAPPADLGRGRRDLVLGRRRTTRTALPGRRARLDRRAPPLRDAAGCHEHPIGDFPDTAAGRSPRPTTPSPARSRCG